MDVLNKAARKAQLAHYLIEHTPRREDELPLDMRFNLQHLYSGNFRAACRDAAAQAGYLPVPQAVRMLGVSSPRVYALVNTGLAGRLRIGGHPYIARADVEARQNRRAQRKPPAPHETRRGQLISYLQSHPDVSTAELIAAGYCGDLQALYRGRINDARRDAGTLRTEERRAAIRAYLQEHPDATKTRLPPPQRTNLEIVYDGSMEAARREAGVSRPAAVPRSDDARTRRILAYLENHPDARETVRCALGESP